MQPSAATWNGHQPHSKDKNFHNGLRKTNSSNYIEYVPEVRGYRKIKDERLGKPVLYKHQPKKICDIHRRKNYCESLCAYVRVMQVSQAPVWGESVETPAALPSPHPARKSSTIVCDCNRGIL